MIKGPIGSFEFGIGVFRIWNWGFKSPIPNPKNANPQLNITNCQLYHHLVIFTFSSLILFHSPFQTAFFKVLLVTITLSHCRHLPLSELTNEKPAVDLRNPTLSLSFTQLPTELYSNSSHLVPPISTSSPSYKHI